MTGDQGSQTGWLVRCSYSLWTSSLLEAAGLCSNPSKSGAPLPPECGPGHSVQAGGRARGG